jgi:uncharacterized damage-inducible protein DinB
MSSAAPEERPSVPTGLLLTHLEYAAWATQKILSMVDALPSVAITQPVISSFPSLLATLQHVYGWDKYYFIHMKGGSIQRESVDEPQTYEALRTEWASLHLEMISWAKENLPARKDIILDGWGVWPTWMIVMQVASHGTHHFGQVVTLLRQLGYAPKEADLTDLIAFYLRRYPQENQKEWLKPLLD